LIASYLTVVIVTLLAVVWWLVRRFQTVAYV
jgi:hypothetical protein